MNNPHPKRPAYLRLLFSDPAAFGYLAAWKILGKLPERPVRKIFYLGADLASDQGRGMEQLRKNLSRVVGVENVTRELVRDSMRSYARYWLEAFRLPSIIAKDPGFAAGLEKFVIGMPAIDASIRSGRGVILTLPHSGNWDMAGVFLAGTRGSFTTVAERLKPEVLYQAFVDYREELGFKVVPLSGGDRAPSVELKKTLADGGVVALLGERDIKGRGVEVIFFGEKTTFPKGPAQLAIDTGAALHVVHPYFDGDTWGLECSPEIPVDTLESTVQRIAQLFERNIAAHPQDWHVLQPLWLKDRRGYRKEH